ncbi:hypothetical protein HELRODRAFT_193902 [Helobdella robusta]|uniref:Platelet-derived growth factor (PDGF) family profile domain-containing protein n=1 Tax=Helobdella robusta TaxID=6412 RepID=T1FVG7_HELRO|nr:hypothetical protein HELRODRAFT_193902 [Helobdella robusta]ESN93861.1 hypothetical protein HELRODRAFT_193902 [Helobdella robusta]
MIVVVINNNITFSNYEIISKKLFKHLRHHELYYAGSGTSGYDDIPEFANCNLIDVPVDIAQPAATADGEDSVEFHWPPSTVLPRCMGGCVLRNDACKASRIEKKNINVRKVKFVNGKYDIIGSATVEVVYHRACDCACKQASSDCHPTKHNYTESKCSCDCKEQKSCSSLHQWSKATCMCLCRQVAECQANEIFSHGTCKCVRDTSLGGDLASIANVNLAQICARKTCPSNQILALVSNPCVCKSP